MRRILPILITFTLTAIATLEAAVAPPQGKAMKITLQLYSGRPNPEFVIKDPYLIQKIQTLLEGMPALSGSTEQAAEPRLGYNGIVIEPSDSTLPMVQSMKVYRTNVQLRNRLQASAAGGSTALPEREERTDSKAELEKLLLKEALDQGVIDQSTLDFMDK